MKNSPETITEKTQTTTRKPGLLGRNKVISTMAMAAITVGCTKDCTSNSSAEEKNDAGAAITSAQAPAAAPSASVIVTTKSAPSKTPTEWNHERCTKNPGAIADNSGVNMEVALATENGRGGSSVATVELCPQGVNAGMAREVKHINIQCGKEDNRTYVQSDGVWYFMGDGKNKEEIVLPLLEDKTGFNKNGGHDGIPYKKPDNTQGWMDAKTSIIVAVRTGKNDPTCATNANNKTASVPAPTLATRTANLTGKTDGPWATKKSVDALTERVDGVEKTANTALKDITDHVRKHLASKPGACVDYKTTPKECENLERSTQNTTAAGIIRKQQN